MSLNQSFWCSPEITYKESHVLFRLVSYPFIIPASFSGQTKKAPMLPLQAHCGLFIMTTFLYLFMQIKIASWSAPSAERNYALFTLMLSEGEEMSLVLLLVYNYSSSSPHCGTNIKMGIFLLFLLGARSSFRINCMLIRESTLDFYSLGSVELEHYSFFLFLFFYSKIQIVF